MPTLSAPTADEILVSIRNVLRQPDSSNSTWTDEELLQYVNEGIRRYFAEIVQFNEGQFTTQDDLDLVSGTASVSLPSDFFQMKTVFRKVTNGYIPLRYDNSPESAYSTTNAGSGDAYLPLYRFQKNQIVLRPAPGFSETDGIRIEYVQFPETVLSAADSLPTQVPPIFRDLIEMYAVYKAKLSEALVAGAQPNPALAQNLTDLYTAFKEAVANRSQQQSNVATFDPELN